MKCIRCGNELAENALFCNKCGAPQDQNTQSASSENYEEISVQSESESIPENSNVSLNKTEVSSTYSIQDNIQNSAVNTENTSPFNAPEKSATDNSKPIIIIAAIAMAMIMTITAVTKISSKSSDKPSTTKSDTTITQSDKETTERDVETTENRDMVSLISICPTYEEFMDKLSPSKISDLSTKKAVDDHMVASFNYSGASIVIKYTENEPHNIKYVNIGAVTASSFNQSWFNSAVAVSTELLYLYLDDVPDSDSSETMFGKFSETQKTEEKTDGYGSVITVSSEYKSKGIEYYTALISSNYTTVYSLSVDIDENYMVEKTK